MSYVIGNNLPGYLPDSDPFVIEGTFDEAKRALIDELLWQADVADTEEEAEELTEAAEDVNLWNGPDTLSLCDRCYWIQEA